MVSHTDYPKHGDVLLRYPDQMQDGEWNLRLRSVDSDDYLILQVFTFDAGEKTFIFTSLNTFGMRNYEVFRVNYYLGFRNHLDESKSEVFIERWDSSTRNCFPGAGLLESEALDEKNGWLKNGKLCVIFGIHVEAFKTTIWKFNFYDPIFQHGTRSDMIGFQKGEDILFHSHKQLLIHHSSLISEKNHPFNWRIGVPDFIKADSLETCLQIVHGAHIGTDLNNLLNVLKIAHYYELYNVIRYCERLLILNKDEIKIVRNRIQFATHCKLRRYLASVLREKESPEAVKEDFRQVNIDRMTGEMMKQCVMYLFRFY
ncbi:unnamed protein product [Caenorhabditis brenneri]